MATTVIKTVKPSGGDYTSLSAWEAGEQRDLVALNEIAVAECYSMSDTTACVINGWITDATRYIRIYTPTSERHAGKWNPAKYRLEQSANWATLENYEDFVRFEGLQVDNTATGSYSQTFYSNGGGETFIDECIGRQSGAGSGGTIAECDNSSGTLIVRDCVLYDSADRGIRFWQANGYIYNTVIYNCNNGGIVKNNSVGSVIVKNCVVFTTADDFFSAGGTFTIDTCASDDGDGTNAVIPANWNNVFMDIAARDFHLKSTDTDLKDKGADLSAAAYGFITDIDGQTRSGTWDIGADEYVAAGGGTIPVSGAAAGISSFTGNSGVAYGTAASVAGLSVLSASAGLNYRVTGALAGISLSSAGMGLQRDARGSINGLSVLSATVTASALITLAGSINSQSSLNGSAALARFLGGSINSTSALSAGAVIFNGIQGGISGVSSLTASLTSQAIKNISGHTDLLSTLAGGVSMGYGLGGSSLSGLLASGYLKEVYSLTGVLSAASAVTGLPVFSGHLSPASLAESPRFDVTRYGGGAVPIVQPDCEMATIMQDNNNPGVTR